MGLWISSSGVDENSSVLGCDVGVCKWFRTFRLIMIYLLTAIVLSPGGSSTVHIYTQTIHRTIQNKQYVEQQNNLGECGPCPILARFTLAFALQLRKKHEKNLSQGSRV